jgi:hypothetical protein
MYIHQTSWPTAPPQTAQYLLRITLLRLLIVQNSHLEVDGITVMFTCTNWLLLSG